MANRVPDELSGPSSSTDGTPRTNSEDRFVDEILLNKQYNSSAHFIDFVLNHYIDHQDTMTWSECMYEIADLVGGNSAVGNLLYRLLGHLVANPDVQEQLYREAASMVAATSEADKVSIKLDDRDLMPLINASILETLRLASSPTVPHVPRKDTSIQGYHVAKGTMVLFNVYGMNMSPDLWQEPEQFNPSRFINASTGSLVKPDYFFPFSYGRRSCLGYKMINMICCATVSNLLLKYRLVTSNQANQALINTLLTPRGIVALPYQVDQCFNIQLVPR